MKPLPLIGMATLCALSYVSTGSAQTSPPLDVDGFARLHALIKPAPGEARWAEVPWMPSTNLWAARQKAAQEGKPLLLWYMAGEPLGTC